MTNNSESITYYKIQETKVKKKAPFDWTLILIFGVALLILGSLIKWVLEDKSFQKILALSLMIVGSVLFITSGFPLNFMSLVGLLIAFTGIGWAWKLGLRGSNFLWMHM